MHSCVLIDGAWGPPPFHAHAMPSRPKNEGGPAECRKLVGAFPHVIAL